MLKKAWSSIKRVSVRLGHFFSPILKPFFRFLSVSSILATGWYAFLSLVSRPPIDATPVLIMIWSSVIVLLFALFPRILDRVKKLKVKDFEIELQDTVSRSTSEEYISFSSLDEYTFSQKGDFRNLVKILEEANLQPSKPILLVVNLRDGDCISIPMLYIYLFFLDMISNVTVLFVTTRMSLRNISDVSMDSIVGAVSGKKIIQNFYRRFPRFFNIAVGQRYFDLEFEEFFRTGHFGSEKTQDIFKRLYEGLRFYCPSNEREFLTEQDVRNWFRGELSFRTVKVALGSHDLKTIREALVQGDEFILSIKDKYLISVISLCYLAKDLSKKVLEEIAQIK